MPSLFDSLQLKSTLKAAISGATTGAKMAAVEKLSSNQAVKDLAIKTAADAAAAGAGAKILDVWKNHKTAIIGGGIGVIVGIPVLIFLAVRGLKKKK